MHSTDGTAGQDTPYSETGHCRAFFKGDGIKGSTQDQNGQEQREDGKRNVVRDLVAVGAVTKVDSAVTDEVHAPDADSTHGQRRGQQQVPTSSANFTFVLSARLTSSAARTVTSVGAAFPNRSLSPWH